MSIATDHSRYLSASQVAHLLNISEQSVYRAVKSGHLEAVRLQPRGALRIPVEALEPHEQTSAIAEGAASGGPPEGSSSRRGAGAGKEK